ncbi:MAG TPA: phosphoribosylaminoimidazole carboxylase, partial [Methanomicrobiales archaeon]|nr:phosphoribosylaminoimidazole carboxylase [Methanomicrobiales archaeon]
MYLIMKVNPSVTEVLQAFRRGELSLEEASQVIQGLQIQAVGDLARLDLGRSLRCGTPEVVLGEGKSPEVLARIMQQHVESNGRSIATRVSREQADILMEL